MIQSADKAYRIHPGRIDRPRILAAAHDGGAIECLMDPALCCRRLSDSRWSRIPDARIGGESPLGIMAVYLPIIAGVASAWSCSQLHHSKEPVKTVLEIVLSIRESRIQSACIAE